MPITSWYHSTKIQIVQETIMHPTLTSITNHMDHTHLKIILAVDAELWTEDTTHHNEMCLGSTHGHSIHANKLWQQSIGIPLSHILHKHQFQLCYYILHQNEVIKYEKSLNLFQTVRLFRANNKHKQNYIQNYFLGITGSFQLLTTTASYHYV